ncbi:MAG: alpha-galactosidase [Anaerolineae bacterium]|nr:alpha-galactosidase [Anaerolineae bacterium]
MLCFELDHEGLLSLIVGGIWLRGAHPTLNNRLLTEAEAQIQRDTPDHIQVVYTAKPLPSMRFGVEVQREGTDALLRYWVQGVRGPLDRFGLHFEAVDNVRHYLLSGYTSWDGACCVEAPGEGTQTGYAFTQIIPRFGSGAVVLGAERHDRFQQPFTWMPVGSVLTLTLETLWDRIPPSEDGRCFSEWVRCFHDPSVEGGLRRWAQHVAQAADPGPRLEARPINGWSSWYDLYGHITAENLQETLQHLRQATQQEGLPMRVFQIDDGFMPEYGDWLETTPYFPNGMKSVVDAVHAAGFTPGLWIAPFLVGNRSRLYHDHPEWVLRDHDNGDPVVAWKRYGENRPFKRSEEVYTLDATHPEVMAYLREVFATWRQEWGCEYFKIDFLHLGAMFGPDQVVYFAPGKTRIEVWRSVARMIRQEIGEAYWLGCGCPLWPAVGLVDGIRISGDVGVSWTGQASAQRLLRDLPHRNFTHDVLWQVDPDAILLREQYHYLSGAEVDGLALFAAMSGGVLMTSDALNAFSERRMALWRFILSETRRAPHYPLLGEDDPVTMQWRPPLAEQRLGALFLFNTGDTPQRRTYPFGLLGLEEAFVYDWHAGRGHDTPIDHLSLTLAPHQGRLFFLSSEPIAEAPTQLFEG